MVDTCAITRRTGTSTLDPNTGVETPDTTSVYSGKCRLQMVPYQPSEEARAGERVVSVAMFVLHVPVSVTGIEADDIVTITAATFDADLTGKTFRVRQEMHKTHPTSRRMIVEETQS